MTSSLRSKFFEVLRTTLVRLDTGIRGVRPEYEVIYQNIFDRDLSRLSIPNDFYPLNAAANYGLMYLILRSARELDIKTIVELGAGQTTLLIDALRGKQIVRGSALTIDHDEVWADQIGSRVRHNVLKVPLVETSDEAHSFQGYDFSSIDLPQNIDFLLIDGPLGWGNGRTFSRHGALPLLDRLDREGFLIIVDDTEREGEKDLARRISSRLASRGLGFRTGQVSASKRQITFASGKMTAAAFY